MWNSTEDGPIPRMPIGGVSISTAMPLRTGAPQEAPWSHPEHGQALAPAGRRPVLARRVDSAAPHTHAVPEELLAVLLVLPHAVADRPARLHGVNSLPKPLFLFSRSGGYSCTAVRFVAHYDSASPHYSHDYSNFFRAKSILYLISFRNLLRSSPWHHLESGKWF